MEVCSLPHWSSNHSYSGTTYLAGSVSGYGCLQKQRIQKETHVQFSPVKIKRAQRKKEDKQTILKNVSCHLCICVAHLLFFNAVCLSITACATDPKRRNTQKTEGVETHPYSVRSNLTCKILMRSFCQWPRFIFKADRHKERAFLLLESNYLKSENKIQNMHSGIPTSPLPRTVGFLSFFKNSLFLYSLDVCQFKIVFLEMS